MCLLSIVIPIFNGEDFLSDCINSVLAQTFADWELLLMDDGSTDRSGSLCQSFVKTDSRINYHLLPHGGVSAARQAGHSLARGEYICFVDIDDRLHPDYARLLLNQIQDTSSDICVCGYQTIKEGKSTSYIPAISETSHPVALLFAEEGVQGFLFNKIYRTKLLTGACFDSGLSYCEDLYMNTLLFAEKSHRISFLPKSLYDYIQHKSSVTNSGSLFRDGKTFNYAPAFDKIFAFLLAKKEQIGYEVALRKYSEILEYSMYCLLTSHPLSESDISKLKQTMRRICPKVLSLREKTAREKIHYLFLAYCPGLYRVIRL